MDNTDNEQQWLYDPSLDKYSDEEDLVFPDSESELKAFFDMKCEIDSMIDHYIFWLKNQGLSSEAVVFRMPKIIRKSLLEYSDKLLKRISPLDAAKKAAAQMIVLPFYNDKVREKMHQKFDEGDYFAVLKIAGEHDGKNRESPHHVNEEDKNDEQNIQGLKPEAKHIDWNRICNKIKEQ